MIERRWEGMKGRDKQKSVQQRGVARRRTMYASGRACTLQWLMTLLLVLTAIGSTKAQSGTGPAGWVDQSTSDGHGTFTFGTGGYSAPWGTLNDLYGETTLTTQVGKTNTISTSGTYHIKYGWNPGSLNVPIPQTVIVHTTSSAGWTGPAPTASGSCDDGLGDAQVPTLGAGSYGGFSSGEKWEVMDSSSGTVTKDVTISASVTATPLTSADSGAIRVSRGAGAVIITPSLNLAGTTPTSPTDGSQNILIGQGCTASLSAPGVTFSNYSWTISSSTFKSYVASTASAVLTNLTASDKTKPTVTFYWVKEDSTPVTVSATASVGGKSIGTVSENKAVKVWEPYWKCPVPTDSIYIIEDAATGKDALVTGDIAIPPFPHTPHSGIKWQGQVTQKPGSPFAVGAGKWWYVQLWTPGRSYTIVSGGATQNWHWSINGKTGLDGAYPYAPKNMIPFPDDNAVNETDDNPAWVPITDFTSVTVSDTFRTYMMYLPKDIGNGAQWVPLNRTSWSWPVSVTRPGNAWNTHALPWNLGYVLVSENAAPCSDHPQWNLVPDNNAPFIQ